MKKTKAKLFFLIAVLLELTGSAYERYVIDIYTSDNQDEYVTEILLPVTHDSEEFNYLGGEFV
ncbi:MAG: hypothetical protein E7221_01165 [Clostridiales bacterium]|nr:hypothetical protein [Clostridiales bacterium]